MKTILFALCTALALGSIAGCNYDPVPDSGKVVVPAQDMGGSDGKKTILLPCAVITMSDGKEDAVDGVPLLTPAPDSPKSGPASPSPAQVVLKVHLAALDGINCESIMLNNLVYEFMGTTGFGPGRQWAVYQEKLASTPISIGPIVINNRWGMFWTKSPVQVALGSPVTFYLTMNTSDAMAGNKLSVRLARVAWSVEGQAQVYHMEAGLPWTEFEY